METPIIKIENQDFFETRGFRIEYSVGSYNLSLPVVDEISLDKALAKLKLEFDLYLSAIRAIK